MCGRGSGGHFGSGIAGSVVIKAGETPKEKGEEERKKNV
jgi:hypothetical protein